MRLSIKCWESLQEKFITICDKVNKNGIRNILFFVRLRDAPIGASFFVRSNNLQTGVNSSIKRCYKKRLFMYMLYLLYLIYE